MTILTTALKVTGFPPPSRTLSRAPLERVYSLELLLTQKLEPHEATQVSSRRGEAEFSVVLNIFIKT